MLIIGSTQSFADPGQTRFASAWSACEKSPQTQYGTLKVPLDWSNPSGATGRQLAPHLQGVSETWQANFCIGWPVKPVNQPKTLNVRGVPTLIIQAAHDPSISYSWAHGLAAQINGSALLTRTGDGHTSVLHLRLCKVRYGCVLDRTARRGERHL